MPRELPTDVRMLRRADVALRVGVSASQLYVLINEGDFPRPIQLSRNRFAWWQAEVDGWLRQRIAERDKPAVIRGRRQPNGEPATASS